MLNSKDNNKTQRNLLLNSDISVETENFKFKILNNDLIKSLGVPTSTPIFIGDEVQGELLELTNKKTTISTVEINTLHGQQAAIRLSNFNKVGVTSGEQQVIVLGYVELPYLKRDGESYIGVVGAVRINDTNLAVSGNLELYKSELMPNNTFLLRYNGMGINVVNITNPLIRFVLQSNILQ